ncbi:hypothetical protein UY3_03659 [Chelonia mydas]|uniref:Uncharacterized protein n=1 Tax=Chelonia mydas TaxID=8469 RepID=M7BPH1_CHEMY|nr:hypothetical protein UY3_03659 [Chelonia mydas]
MVSGSLAVQIELGYDKAGALFRHKRVECPSSANVNNFKSSTDPTSSAANHHMSHTLDNLQKDCCCIADVEIWKALQETLKKEMLNSKVKLLVGN